MLDKINPTTTKAWTKLAKHYEEMKAVHLKSLFNDEKRFETFSLRFEDILFDYSKNIVTSVFPIFLKEKLPNL